MGLIKLFFATGKNQVKDHPKQGNTRGHLKYQRPGARELKYQTCDINTHNARDSPSRIRYTHQRARMAWSDIHMVDAVAPDTCRGKHLTETENTHRRPDSLDLRNNQKTDSKTTKPNGLHELSHKRNIHARCDHSICYVSGNVQT